MSINIVAHTEALAYCLRTHVRTGVAIWNVKDFNILPPSEF